MSKKALSYYNWKIRFKKKEKEEDKESKGLNEDEFEEYLKKWKEEKI